MKARHWLIIIALAALGLVGYLNWHDVVEAFRLFKSINFVVLALVPVILSLSILANASYYRSFLRQFGYNPSLKKLYKMSLGLNFVNQISPSVGLTGVTFLSYVLRKEGVPAGKVTIVQYGRYALTYFSFSAVIALALGFLYFGGGIDKIVVRIVIIIVAISLVASLLLIFALSSRRRLNGLVYWVQRGIDWVSGHLRNGRPLIGKDRITRLLREFHQGLDLVIKERHRLKVPLLFTLMASVMELSALYVVFLALGIYINPGAVIISYAVANGVGIISIIPGDVGVYEVALVSALAATGAPVAIGLSATLLYRVINKALLLPFGFYFYSQFLGRKSGQPNPQR